MSRLGRKDSCQGVLAAISSSNFSAFILGCLGTILYRNGRGRLGRVASGTAAGIKRAEKEMTSVNVITYTAFPVENNGSTGISAPFSSRGLKILNTANTLAITDHTDVSAK